MATIYVSDEELKTGSIYDRMCVCGHKLSYHGFVVYWSLNSVSVSQCTHPDCQIREADPRPDRRKRQTYTHKFACEQFRPA